MTGQLIMVGGGKGGVGKSLVAMAALDYLRSINSDVLLIEADRQNQDVALAYQSFETEVVSRHAASLPESERADYVQKMKPMQIEIIDLLSRDNWVTFGRLIQQHRHRRIVVNTAVGLTDNIDKYGGSIANILSDSDVELVSLWPVNRQRFSLNALLRYSAVVTTGRIHILRNLLFGEPQQFVLLAGAQNVRKLVTDRGGALADFPDLADLMADRLYTDRLAIETAATDPDQFSADRSEFQRWQAETRALMSALL